MNQTLRKIYELCPAIAAWMRNPDNMAILWPSKLEAVRAIEQYVGPLATTLYAKSLHLSAENTEFLRSQDAFQAIVAAIQALYDRDIRFHEGLFYEESTAHG